MWGWKTAGGDLMDDNTCVRKEDLERMIKQNMVPLKGMEATPRMYWTTERIAPSKFTSGPDTQSLPASYPKWSRLWGRGRDTVDISSADFLILNRIPPSTL
jgi:hypothetical protein